MKNQKLLAASILAVSFLLSLSIIQVQAADNDSSITLKKDRSTDLFVLTIRDPDGIQEFSLSPAGKSPYGGGLSGCKKSFSNNTAVFDEFSDFTPVMPAYVIDCNNNKTELEIPPPIDGITKGIAVRKEEPPPLPPAPPPKAEKKEGPLAAEDIRYPVLELGSCQNETECRSYCDNANRAKECFAFAKKYNLISEEKAKEAADKFLNVKNGPGGCNSGASCEDYCNNVDRLDECIAFAEESGYYSPEQLAEAKKFQELVKSGAQFPGNCTDRNSCEIYCNEAGHIEECLNFAEKSGFMPQAEIDDARKFMALMQKGESPGGCISKEQCENYCALEGNIEECIAFAEKAGVMTAEEAEMARKVGGKGPGGCRSKEQCETYCEANSEECFNFAKEKGLISEADLAKMSEGMARFRDELDKMPPEAVECMKDAAGEENFNKMLAGEPVFDRSLEEKMKSCFSQVTAQFSQQFDNLPPEAAECIKDAIGEDELQKLQRGEAGEDLDFGSLENCFRDLKQSLGGGSPGGGEGHDGFTECGITTGAVAEYVCGINGKGAPPGKEITYFNRCHAEQQGVEVLHEGVCKGQEPICSDIADPVCGNDNNSWTNACHAEEIGGGVKHKGVCTREDFGGQSGGGGGGVTPPPTQSCAPLPSGLVSWLDDDNTLSDAGGGVTLAPGKIGNALKFDASGGYVKDENSEKLNFGTGPFSLETWFNWDGGGSSKGNIIRKANYPVSGDGAGYWLAIGKDNSALEFFTGETVGNPGKSRGSVSSPISPGVWYHAAATRDGNGTMKLYVNGELKGTAEAANANTTSPAPFTLGAWDDRFGITELFSGLIDEASVYNKALSASEVQAIFNAGGNGKCTGSSESQSQQQYQQPPQSQPPTNYSGPGGCKTSEECTAYCTTNYQDPACRQ